MNMIAHNAKSIEFETKFVLCFLDSVQKHLTTLIAGEAKLSVIATGGNVIAISWLEIL